MQAASAKARRNLAVGLGFLAPNIAGFLVFTMIPLAFSLVLAFSNWDLKLHNMFKDEPIRFIGFENFARLITQPEFWRYLGNTLFFMMIVPFSIAGSLILALLLTRDLRGGHRGLFAFLLGGAVMASCCVLLAAMGAGASAMGILLAGMACGILVLGVAGASTFYRTLFFLPHFCSGVATFILWKKLYSPHAGPINQALAPVLDVVGRAINAAPRPVVQANLWLCLAAMGVVTLFALRRVAAMHRDGEVGWAAAILPHVFLALPWLMAFRWAWGASGAARGAGVSPGAFYVFAALAAFGALALFVAQAARFARGQDYRCAASNGAGGALMFALAMMVAQLIALGLGIVFFRLPAMAAAGLQPPDWIVDYDWANPSLMFMALWGAIGSNNMLLYIAGLSNVPQELY